jgi:hypothetical protein
MRASGDTFMTSTWISIPAAVVVLLFLLLFAGVGVAHVLYPDRFIRRNYGVRKGGEMLTEWNRLGFRIAGAIFALFALWLLYKVFWPV